MKRQNLLATMLGVLFFSLGSANAAGISCQNLETASAEELWAMVDPQSIQYGGVRLGESECDVNQGQKVCDWKQTLEDDEMLDRDHRLLYVLSTHQTGSGSWQDLMVFGCVAGQVKNIFVGQLGEDTSVEEVLSSTPWPLRSVLTQYVNHLRTISPIDCGKALTELQAGKSIAKVAKEMNVVMGSVQRCREGARKNTAQQEPSQ